jgi:hypothetical protein
MNATGWNRSLSRFVCRWGDTGAQTTAIVRPSASSSSGARAMVHRLTKCWDGFWKWADRVGIIASLVNVVIGMIGAAITAIGARLEGMPWSVIGVLSLTAFVGLIWTCNGLVWLASRKRATNTAAFDPRLQTILDPWSTLPEFMRIYFFQLFCDARHDVETLLGTWHVSVGDRAYEWTFKADQSVSSTQDCPHGVWSIRELDIKIQWTEQAWEVFPRPIIPTGIRGASWTKKPVLATKLANPKP